MINNILNINFNNINEVENTLETISQNFMSDNLIIVIGINQSCPKCLKFTIK